MLSAPLLLALSTNAFATDVDAFQPASSVVTGVGTLQAESPLVLGEGFSGGLLGNFAQNPVVRTFQNGDRESAVSSMVPLHVYGGYTVADTVRVDVFLPVYATVNAPVSDFTGPAVGDLRLQGVIPVHTVSDALSFAVIPRLGIPTGNENALTRQGFQGSVAGSMGGEVPDVDVGWVANLGVTGSGGSELEGVGIGSTFDFVTGGWWHPSDPFRVGAEVDVKAGLAGGTLGANHTSSMHLFAQQMLPNGVGLTLGGGTGLIAGLGSPDFRINFGLHYAELVQDRDRDGIVDADDACVDDAEDLDGNEDADGCPDLDDDHDGVADVDDQCDTPEDLDGWQDADGCPDPDNDGDGILDDSDACPDSSGTAEFGGCPDSDGDGIGDNDDECRDTPGAPEAKGCPDADSDGVADAVDSCPDQPKPTDEPVDMSDGCPKDVFVGAEGIEFNQSIAFKTGSATIERSSFEVLAQLAELIKAHPEIIRIEIQGHTDNVGEADRNLALSQERADAVMKHMTVKGVHANRLSAKGYGQTQPIDSNRSAKGRARNRRVAFVILAQAEAAGASGASPNAIPGQLAVVVPGGNWANVYVDDERLSKGAPFEGLNIAPGKHTIWVANQNAGIDYTEEIVVESGKSVRVVVPSKDAPKVEVPPSSGMGSPWDLVPEASDDDEKASSPWGSLDDEDEPQPEVDTSGKRPPRSSKKK